MLNELPIWQAAMQSGETQFLLYNLIFMRFGISMPQIKICEKYSLLFHQIFVISKTGRIKPSHEEMQLINTIEISPYDFSKKTPANEQYNEQLKW